MNDQRNALHWFTINNLESVDSPALVVYKSRVQENIRHLLDMVPNVSVLRPHIKTNKMAEVCQLMMKAGIQKFKCATIAEAEMLGMIQAPDVLIAYQPVGPKINRFLQLVQTYPATTFSCLTDNETTAAQIAGKFLANNKTALVYLDINNGMNRTGIKAEAAFKLFETCTLLPGLNPVGLHGYDGHIRDTDPVIRQQTSDDAFQQLDILSKKISDAFQRSCQIVTGGSPSFPTHAKRKDIECSPGTFVFWDWGYKNQFPDEPFDYAALVITRVISVIDSNTICTDLGHKAVAAENPLPRVYFLNAPELVPVSQSEEHLVLHTSGHHYQPGDVLYGVPVHICPTVALYEEAHVVEENQVTSSWKIIARNRKINI
ncbi:MAG: D-TA family PLP-dependent enzyme [Bacteroidota bacterium]